MINIKILYYWQVPSWMVVFQTEQEASLHQGAYELQRLQSILSATLQWTMLTCKTVRGLAKATLKILIVITGAKADVCRYCVSFSHIARGYVRFSAAHLFNSLCISNAEAASR